VKKYKKRRPTTGKKSALYQKNASIPTKGKNQRQQQAKYAAERQGEQSGMVSNKKVITD